MLTLNFPITYATALCREYFDDEMTEEMIEKALRSIFFGTLTACIQQDQANLDYLYNYVKLRDVVTEATEAGENELNLTPELFAFVVTNFENFQGWKVQYAEIVLLMAEEIKRLKEMKPNV